MPTNLTLGKALACDWRITVSDIPGHDLDLRLVDNFIRGWTSPTLNLGSIWSNAEGWGAQFAEPDRNRDGFDLNLTLAISEDWVNYWCFCDWLLRVKKGEVESPHNEYRMAQVVIFLMDTSKRERMAIRLHDLVVESISGITGVSGTSEELTFDLQLKATDVTMELFGVANGTPGVVGSPNLIPKIEDGNIDTPIKPYGERVRL